MNKIDLRGKMAVVTGGARGIGYAIGERLLESGASCSIWDHDAPVLKSAAAALSAKGRVHTTTVDVTQAESVQAAAQATVKEFGRVDILVNNAGIAGATKPTWELSPGEWQQVLQIDLFGVYLCCHSLVPGMRERGYGRIVNIASIAGKEGNPNMTGYSSTKAAVIGFTKSLGKEVATEGICVNAVAPAVVRTKILSQLTDEQIRYMTDRIPMKRTGAPEEIAAVVHFLASPDCSFVTAQCYDASGGRATY